MRNNKLMECVYRPLLREGVDMLHELIEEEESERDRNRLKRIRMVILAFPEGLLQLESSYYRVALMNMRDVNYIISESWNWLELNTVATKELQSLLKVALHKVSYQNHDAKMGIERFLK